MFSLLFSECFHLYLRKPTAAKSPILVCCITYTCGYKVYLVNQSLRAETHLGPDGTRPKQNTQAMHAG